MKIHQKREIKNLKKEIKNLRETYSKKIKESRSVKKKFKKKDLKYLSVGRALSITEGPERLINEKEQKIKDIKKKLIKFQKCL